jgi:adenylate/nucleoside-diphosphate kinase
MNKVEEFLENPEKFSTEKLPEIVPQDCTKDMLKSLFPIQLELKGYCPVTFFEGPVG